MSCKPTKKEILDWMNENKESYVANFEIEKIGNQWFDNHVKNVNQVYDSGKSFRWPDVDDWGFDLPSDACTFSFNKGLDRSHRKRYVSIDLTNEQIEQLQLVKEVILGQPYHSCASFGQAFFSVQGCCGRLEIGIIDKIGCEEIKKIIEEHSIPLIRDFSNK